MDMNYIDAKKFNEEELLKLVNSQNSFWKSYIYSRYSSRERIIFSTSICTIFGCFLGWGLAIHKDIKPLNKILKYGGNAFGLSTTFFIFNEMYNGFIKRINNNKEQYFYSNSAAAIMTILISYSIQSLVLKKPTKYSLNLSIKYAGSICVYSMLQEIFIIQIRDIYLGRRKIEDYKISIRKKENVIKDEEKK